MPSQAYLNTLAALQSLSTLEEVLLRATFIGQEAKDVANSIAFVQKLFASTQKGLENFDEHKQQLIREPHSKEETNHS